MEKSVVKFPYLYSVSTFFFFVILLTSGNCSIKKSIYFYCTGLCGTLWFSGSCFWSHNFICSSALHAVNIQPGPNHLSRFKAEAVVIFFTKQTASPVTLTVIEKKKNNSEHNSSRNSFRVSLHPVWEQGWRIENLLLLFPEMSWGHECWLTRGKTAFI